MTIEEVLIELGDQRLALSGYSKVLMAMLNAFLPGDKPVSIDMNGHEILTLIYQLPNEALQTKILGKQVGRVRGSDSYRNAVLATAALFIAIAMFLAIRGMRGDGPMLWSLSTGILRDWYELFKK